MDGAWSYLDESGEGCVRPARCLDEPLVVTDDGSRLRVLSNACTHRGALLVEEASDARSIRCPYHGRRFGLDGRVIAAPGFDEPPDEPLPELALASLGPIRFAAYEPPLPFDALIAPVRTILDALPFDALEHDRAADRHYDIAAPWTLWAENFLEGLHIPFVHPRLAKRLALASYEVEVHEHCAVQYGEAAKGQPSLRVGEREVGGYYLFVYPTTALNLYPWGVSLNAIVPRAEDAVRVLYRSYVWAAEHRDAGAGAGLDAVELEDDAVVERTARGNRARLFEQGRLSEPQERAVAWFRRKRREG